MDDIIVWEDLGENTSVCNPNILWEHVFEKLESPADGNCFFHSVSTILNGEFKPESYRVVKEVVKEAAENFWQQCPEARVWENEHHAGLEQYIEVMLKENTWGGSLEADLISRQLNITLILWVVDTDNTITAGQRFGRGRVSEAVNLFWRSNHFDPLIPIEPGNIGEHAAPQEFQLPLNVKMSLVSESLYPYMDEDGFLGEEDGSDLLTVGREPKIEASVLSRSLLLEKNAKLMEKASKLIPKDANIPARVGRILDQFFSCRIGCRLDENMLLLIPTGTTNSEGTLSIRQAGHRLLTKEKKIRDEFLGAQLKLSEELLAFVDTANLLRISFPGLGLVRFMDSIHMNIILDICTIAVSVLLSAFLYGTELNVKRDFLSLSAKSLEVDQKKFTEAVRSLNVDIFRSRPRSAVRQVVEAVVGEKMRDLHAKFLKMDPVSLFALRNLNLGLMTTEEYYTLINELSTADNKDVDFNHKEVKDLNNIVNCLEKIWESTDASQLKAALRKAFSDGSIPDAALRNQESAQKEAISEFFRKKSILKFISISGKAYSGANVGNVLAYAYNLYLSKDNLDMTLEDMGQLTIDIRRLNSLQSKSSATPIALIVDGLKSAFDDLLRKLPKQCSEECGVLLDDVRNASSHAVAWKAALRIKGTAYEGLFANSRNWAYRAEDVKPTLSMMIQSLYPEKFERFLEKTQLHPEFRDLTPDFALAQKVTFPSDVIQPPEELTQISLEKDSEGVVPVKRGEQRMFPLPEEELSELHSVDGAVHSFEDPKSESMKKRVVVERNLFEPTFEETLSRGQLLLVEVGYQTDVEGKMMSDSKKWKDVLGLLKMLGIKCTIVCCVDTSRTAAYDWWIGESDVSSLKSSIGRLFYELQKNSPTEVTDFAIGSISTQKMRTVLRSGNIIKTPVATKDVLEGWKNIKEEVINRPTGLRISEKLERCMETGLVQGVVMEQEGAVELMTAVLQEQDRFIDRFIKTKNAHTLNKSLVTAQEMLIGWLKDDLSAAVCRDCYKNTLETCKTLSNPSQLETLCYKLRLQNHTPCCHSQPVKTSSISLYMKKVPRLEEVQHSSLQSFEDTDENVSLLDRLVRLTLPGKTEKERKVKRAVESLIRLVMEASEIDAIKLASGQIVLNRKLKMQHSEKKSEKEEQSKSGKYGKSLELLEERRKKLAAALSDSKLQGYSSYAKKIIRQSLTVPQSQKNSKCEVPGEWMNMLLKDLKLSTEDATILQRIKESYDKKVSYTVNNDKVVIPESRDIGNFLMDKFDKVMCRDYAPIFSLDCFLFKEVYFECAQRLSGTPYDTCTHTMGGLIYFMLSFCWFQELVLYSKICETFLRCCTEFHRSGIKLVKIRHTTLNLAIKLPANKKENMTCCIYSSEMQLLKGPFILNRRQAVLGAAYSYMLVVLFTQCLQQHRCLDIVNEQDGQLKDDVLRCFSSLADVAFKSLRFAYTGNFEDSHKELQKTCAKSGNYLNRSSRAHFIQVFAGLTMTYYCLVGDCLLANSQPQNKQLQMLRFGMLNGLSRMSCPKELGKKFSSSCRRIEDLIMRLYLQVIVYGSCRDVEENIIAWKAKDLCPEITIPCFSVFGLHVNGDRQLIFDIYNVHIYNKELDNFDEGCIKVLEETAERHMQWEMDLLKNSGDSNHDYRNSRLLLGIPNVKRSRQDFNGSDAASNASSKSSMEVSSGASTASSKFKLKSIFGRYAMVKPPFELETGFEISRSESLGFRQVVSDIPTYQTYQPNVQSVLRDCDRILSHNPSYTFGSFELIQAVTEFCRTKYPPDNIDRARRSPRNWVSISEVTETTSIVSNPRSAMYLKDCLRILMCTENKKIVKMMRGKFQRLGIVQTKVEEGKVKCEELLATVSSLTAKQKEDIIKGLFEPSKLAFFHWTDIIQKRVEEVLLTDDGNYIYCWLKSLSSGIKSSLKRKLKFMRLSEKGTVQVDSATQDLLAPEEITSLTELASMMVNNSEMDDSKLDTKLLLSAWVKCCESPKESKRVLKEGRRAFNEISSEVAEVFLKFNNLCQLKSDYPALSFTREEAEIRTLERTLLKKKGAQILRAVNLIFYAALCAPWCIHYKMLEAYFVKNPSLVNLDDEELEVGSRILDLNITRCLTKLLIQNESSLTSLSRHEVVSTTKYLVTMFTANGLPFTEAISQPTSDDYVSSDQQLLAQTRSVTAQLGLTGARMEFQWTCHLIANSNFEVTKKLTGRSTGERLPRSVRSKVIYEMVKLVNHTGMAVLQQLAFSQILDSGHRFFAVLAPKAQLGGPRDLLVQETGTKIVHATSEAFSRSLLATTQDDGLTNPTLKNDILSMGFDMLRTSTTKHGKLLEQHKSLKNFHKTFCISGDNTKWGPIHCCSLFSAMMQQLLRDVPDWSNFYKLVFLKNLCREVEIPAASIKKIMNAFRYKMQGGVELSQLSESKLREKLRDSLGIWEGNDIIAFLVQTYICQGKMAMTSYNHMGQGIHHATSSLLTSIMGAFCEHMARAYYKKVYPELTVHVEHAGSSDDYAKCISLIGVVSEEVFIEYESNFWQHACRFKNYLASVMRCCQMKDSAKTLVSDCFLEFYSEFMMGNRTTPAVIKFVFTGLINSSVTSPQSMNQACQVSAQQAMYNSVPLQTNLTFSVLRQQMFLNHIEPFIRDYGLVTLGSLSSFGRLYIPVYSNLITSSIALEDSETIHHSANELVRNGVKIHPSSRSNLEAIEEEQSDSSSYCSESSEAKSTSSGSSFRFDLKRTLTQSELQYLKTVKEKRLPHSCEVTLQYINWMYDDSKDGELDPKWKLRQSRIVQQTEWMSETSDDPLLTALKIRCVLNMVIAGYYRTFSSSGTERTVKASMNRDENRVVEDPMIQLVPEKLRRELERLGLSKMTVNEMMAGPSSTDTLSGLVAKRLVVLNTSTEDYSSEVSRLKQTLTARNVLHGLAGGIKELSLPIYSIFFKSYFFIDNIFHDLDDKWNSRHSRNYRDSSGKELTGRTVTKYSHWLETLLDCQLTINRIKGTPDPNLFNSCLRGVDLLTAKGKPRELSLIIRDIEFMGEQFKNLSLEFSDVNRQKIKILESRPAVEQIEANKVVIVKSLLFNASDQVRLSNSPAVVMGYLLDETVLSVVKPTKVDGGNLLKDKFKVQQFYPALMDLLKAVLQESKIEEDKGIVPDLERVSRYASNLTLLCRMIQQAKPSVSSFYMMKGSMLGNETTVTELLSYGIQEGRYMQLPETELDASSFSLRYWKILHCISVIGGLPLNDSEKTTLLTSFLNWKPSLGQRCEFCPLKKLEQATLEEFDGKVLVNVLASELSSIRRERERGEIADLIDYVCSPSELLKKKPYLGTTVSFRTWGEGQTSGKFTFSSGSGEALGMFVGGKLHMYLSDEKDVLIQEVERSVLAWLSKRRTDVVSKEQHNYFLGLLPTLSQLGHKPMQGTIVEVSAEFSESRRLRLTRQRRGGKVVIIKGKILTVQKQMNTVAESEPRLVWGKGSVSIVYDEVDLQSSYHEQILEIKKLIDKNVEDRVGQIKSMYSDRRVVLSKLRFMQDVTLNSATLLHIFLKHTPSDAILEASSKSALLNRFLTEGTLKVKPIVEGVIRGDKERIHKEGNIDISSGRKGLLREMSLEKEVCSRLEEEFNRECPPEHSWPEAQTYLEDIGFHSILVQIEKNEASGAAIWKFRPDFETPKSASVWNFRTLAGYISSETLPSFLFSFIVDESLLDVTVKTFKQVRNAINSKNIQDDVLDLAICCHSYMTQNEKPVRKELYFTPKSILSLSKERSFKMNKDLSISFETGVEGIYLFIEVRMLRSSAVGPDKLKNSEMAIRNVLREFNRLCLSWNAKLLSDVSTKSDKTEKVVDEHGTLLKLKFAPGKSNLFDIGLMIRSADWAKGGSENLTAIFLCLKLLSGLVYRDDVQKYLEDLSGSSAESSNGQEGEDDGLMSLEDLLQLEVAEDGTGWEDTAEDEDVEVPESGEFQFNWE